MREFGKPLSEQIIEQSLLELPEQRAGYNDRAAWLMAVMSQLAYFEFENHRTVADLAADLAKLGSDKRKIKHLLPSQVGGLFTGGPESRYEFLAHVLGVERYLTVAEPGMNDTYPDLEVIPNPGIFLRLERFIKRVRSTRGKGLIRDHAIGIYRAKLRARAISRNYAMSG